MITIEKTDLENNTCRFLLFCGMCEVTKKKCTKLIAPERINIPTWDTTPITTKEWKVGDWPPGPQITCSDNTKDLASNPDTFRVHFEDLPRYNAISKSCYDNSFSTVDMYNLSGTMKSD